MKDYQTNNWVLDCARNTFDRPKIKKWFQRLFYISELIQNQSQSKQFDWIGVAITTQGVKALLHYERINHVQVGRMWIGPMTSLDRMGPYQGRFGESPAGSSCRSPT